MGSESIEPCRYSEPALVPFLLDNTHEFDHPEDLALDHATQAEAAASRQEYQQASELFAQAASPWGWIALCNGNIATSRP